MRLLDSECLNKEQWAAAEIKLPEFDREAMKAATKERPQWVHFGAGNIFRAFPAALQQKLLNEGAEKTGIIVAEGYDYEIIKKAYRPQDDLSLLVTLKANGTIEKTVIGSLAESLTVDRQDEADWSRLKDIFASSALQMVSFTITEKGYSITSRTVPSGLMLRRILQQDLTKRTVTSVNWRLCAIGDIPTEVRPCLWSAWTTVLTTATSSLLR